jgi:hypothetical protein
MYERRSKLAKKSGNVAKLQRDPMKAEVWHEFELPAA